uniref:Putative secreted protein n=1 Tax=Amblyomma aureolatum TaxID=187763 RepID=A0A1E1WY93_9ACAR
MSSLGISLALLTFSVFIHIIGADDDIWQRPVIPSLPGRNGTRKPDSWIGHGTQNKGVGEICSNDGDCKWYLCCLSSNGTRSCQRKKLRGEACSDGQIKGGYHRDNCPCLMNEDECKWRICRPSYRRHRRRTW